MDYKQAREYLAQTLQFGSKLGLERMNKLMELLGNPGREITYYHVAGTNGKGSVATMVSNCLAAGGHKVGIYTSPYIERFAERIRVLDGRNGLLAFYENESHGEIPDVDFAICMTQIKPCVDLMLSLGMEHPTEFELVTAVAFIYFANTNCDMVVLETGLGGRLDSTNVISNPKKCIITAIGYDHMDRLGNTIGEIAYEKAGIIKSGSQVVLYDPNEYSSPIEADIIFSVIKKQCILQKVKCLSVVTSNQIHMKSYCIEGQTFYFNSNSNNNMDLTNGIDKIEEYGDSRNKDIVLSVDEKNVHLKPDGEFEFFTTLLGVYQPMNCAIAIETCKDIVDMDSIKLGIKLTKWPARMELVKKSSPLAFLDGGHNMQGAIALKDTLEKLQEGHAIVFLCGVLQDKEYEKMLSVILSSSQYAVEAVFCTMPDNPRALIASNLAKSVSEILDNLPQSSYNRLATVIFDNDVKVMIDKALQFAIEKDATFVAFGSLYMAGEIRQRFRHDWNKEA